MAAAGGERSRRPAVSAAVDRLHAAAVAAGEPTYRDPATGFDVFTTAALAERGRCCENACRHCPYRHGTVDLPPTGGAA